MFITEEEMKRRLGSNNNLANKFVGNSPTIPVKPIDPISTTVDNIQKDVDIKKASDILGISPEILAPAPSINPSPVDRVREAALDIIVKSIAAMHDDKIEGASLKELGALSSNMASVVDRLSPKENNTDNRVQFVVYTPAMRNEASYDVVKV